MYPLGIIIPTFFEGGLVLKNCCDEPCTIQGKHFFKTSISGKDIVISICGIGKTNAAHSTGLLIERFNPFRIINIGVAGAYANSELKIGDLVLAEKDIYADEGVMTFKDEFISMQSLDLPLLTIGEKKFFNEFETFIPQGVKGDMKRGTFLTVSTCTGSLKKGLSLSNHHSAICENMEGAAIAHIATSSNIPFIEIRAISNIINDRDKEGIDKNDLLNSAIKVQEYLLNNIEKMID